MTTARMLARLNKPYEGHKSTDGLEMSSFSTETTENSAGSILSGGYRFDPEVLRDGCALNLASSHRLWDRSIEGAGRG
ncbi:hypothetical protein EVAR_20686_1 [Eumeta japonica]|uniref:Uncharacterized protein n=1 Tax=Eumeta variegata TaxID=151549 RepID=A0A4C1V996_EUMVA|nr:hypothetical protein EVAR_20686_1 [Eumeta japonica]